jgi:surface antigen
MKAWNLALISALVTGSVAQPASAQAMGFMEYSPIAYYTDEDNRMADEAGLDALDNYSDMQVRTWRNPATGASGSITPLETYTNDAGHTCRKARAVDRTSNPPLQGQFVFDLCKDPQKGWQFVKM